MCIPQPGHCPRAGIQEFSTCQGWLREKVKYLQSAALRLQLLVSGHVEESVVAKATESGSLSMLLANVCVCV